MSRREPRGPAERLRPASVFGKIWTSPNTALGISVGAVAVMLGARVQRGRNALEFLDNPFVAACRVRAITLGNTIHYAPGWGPRDVVTRYDGSAQVGLGEHEESHTFQYERWGPFFLPVYFVCWLPWIAHAGNRFEHAADDHAARLAGADRLVEEGRFARAGGRKREAPPGSA